MATLRNSLFLLAWFGFTLLHGQSDDTTLSTDPATREAQIQRILQEAIEATNAPSDSVLPISQTVDITTRVLPSTTTNTPSQGLPNRPIVRRPGSRAITRTNTPPVTAQSSIPSRQSPTPVTPNQAQTSVPNPNPLQAQAQAQPGVTPQAPPNANVAGALPTDSASSASALTTEETIAISALNYGNMPLEQFLDIYAEFVGKTLLAPSTLPLQTQISLKAQTPLTRKEAIEAMDSVLALNGITMIPTGEKFVTAVPVAQAMQEGARPSTSAVDQLPEASQFITHVVQLKHADPEEVVQVITPFAKNPAGLVAVESTRTLVLRDYAINVKRMLEIIDQIDINVPLEFIPEMIPIKYALASDIAQVLGSLTASGVTASVGSSARSGGGSLLSGRNNSTGVGNDPNNPNQRTTPTTNNRSSFQQRVSQIARRASADGETEILGEVKIIPDERTNAILVFATKEDLEMIHKIVDKLDVVLAQVLIEAIILEVSLNDTLNFGVSLFPRAHSAGSFTGVGASNNGQFPGGGSDPASFPSGFSYFGSFGDDLDIALRALAGNGSVNIVQRPRIQTSHAVPASFFVGDTVPYITGSTFGSFSGVSSRSSYQQLRVGVELGVMPLINTEGLVVMEIEQTIDQLGTPVTIDGNEVPTTTSRTASATVAVQDGETIILGGFIKSDRQKSRSGVPVLKDIPVLGALFRSQNNSNQRTEMVVLMRPTVLPTPQVASKAAQDLQNKLPGIQTLTEDFDDNQLVPKKKTGFWNRIKGN